MIDKHIMPVFGERAIDAIRKMDVEAWVAGLGPNGLARSTGKFLLCQLR